MAVTCPQCHFENPSDTRFCGNCATPLPGTQANSFPTAPQPSKILAKGSFVAGKYQIEELMSYDGGEAEKTFPLRGEKYYRSEIRWTPDGQALTYSAIQRGVSNIWIQPLAGGPARQLTRFATDDIWDFDWTPDNRLILARGPVNQDIVLISNRQSR